MAYNVMNEYSKITIKQLNEYMKLILDNKYNKSICDEFTNVYINIRYNGLVEGKRGLTVRNKLLSELKNKEDKLLENFPDKQKNIEYTYLFFDDCAYFDTADIDEDISSHINNIIENRVQYLENDETLEKEDELRKTLEKTIKDNIKEKDEFLNKFSNNEFILEFKNYSDNLQRVYLKYNIKFSMIYSIQAIDKAFDTGLIKEDKLFVEYYLTSAKVINDIENSAYRKEYLVDIDEGLFEKDQKILRLLEIINNPTLQDRIIIEIEYGLLKEYKDKIYEMVSNGYKIAIRLREDFNGDDLEVQRLSLFKYVITTKNNKNDLLKNLDNLIIID